MCTASGDSDWAGRSVDAVYDSVDENADARSESAGAGYDSFYCNGNVESGSEAEDDSSEARSVYEVCESSAVGGGSGAVALAEGDVAR